MKHCPESSALLTLPRLRVQNANAISSSTTHGFPSITAFLGLMWALQRKLNSRYPITLQSVGVICHAFDEQITDDNYPPHTFKLTRNPLDRDGSVAAIVEEGRIHLDVTLVFGIDGNEEFFNWSDEECQRIAMEIACIVETMHVAGGTVIPVTGRRKPSINIVDEDEAKAAQLFRQWRRRWLPGFALVARDDLLQQRLEWLRKNDPATTALDAWLDLSRFNWKSHEMKQIDKKNDETKTKIEWRSDYDKDREGWIVPIPVGYGALSDTYLPGSVINTRDMETPFRFVESLYSIGEWISPHRLRRIEQLLWYSDTDLDKGLYRARNDYVSIQQNN